MKIINSCEEFRIFDFWDQCDDLYFSDSLISARPYRNSLVIIDLANAMKNGKACTRWLFSVSPWHMDTSRLSFTAYIKMAAPECDTLASVLDHIGGLVSANIFPTKKRAREVADYWNRRFMENGTYFFDGGKTA